MIKVERILFPTDFSPYSLYALKYACSFAREYKATLYILHVIDIQRIPPMLGISYDRVIKDLEKDARKRLKELVIKEEDVKGIKVETMIRHGSPFVEIIKTCKELNIDLITIATHGYTGLKHVLFGSTAENVVRNSPCPVLTVRHPEHEFVMP